MTENVWCPTCVVYAALLEAATDGDTSIGNAADSANTSHTVEETAESDESSTEAPIPDSAADSDDLHSDAKGLVIGEVLGFDRDGTNPRRGRTTVDQQHRSTADQRGRRTTAGEGRDERR